MDEPSQDVEFLKSYEPLQVALEGAKSGVIDALVDLGLSRWELDSRIREFPEVASHFAEFSLLLEGWELPRGTGGIPRKSE